MKTDSWISEKYECSICHSNIIYCQSKYKDYYIYCSQKFCENHNGAEVYDDYREGELKDLIQPINNHDR